MNHAFAVVFVLIASPAMAAQTAWQEVAPGVKLRVISSGRLQPDGHTLAGLQIDMPSSTRTYWRVPGESGIPAQFDITGSAGVSARTVAWPYPAIDQRQGYTDFVYWGNVVLPLDLTVAGETPRLALAVTLGICAEVCVPAQARFELPLDLGTADQGNGLRLQQALALAPLPWTDARPAINSVSYDAVSRSLAVRIGSPAVDPQSVIVSTASGEPLFGAPQKSPEPGLVHVPILGNPDLSRLENLPVQLTFMSTMGAYDMALRVKVGK